MPVTDTPEDTQAVDRTPGRYGEPVADPTQRALDAIERATKLRASLDEALTVRDDAIIEMHHAGMNPPTIARRLAMSVANVRHILGPPRRRA